MKLRHVLAAGTVGIIGILGTAGVAAAQNTTTPSPHDKQALCAKATGRLPNLQDRIAKVDARISTLQTRLTDAQSKNQTNRTRHLQARIGWAHTVHDHLINVVDAINRRCPA
jgi:peptidoglycan hydrolase CwlO-like protein